MSEIQHLFEQLKAEVARMQKVIDAVRKWRREYTADSRYELDRVIDEYEKDHSGGLGSG
jgi:valyl-tRNA synthetase